MASNGSVLQVRYLNAPLKNSFYFPKEMHPPSSTEKETSSKTWTNKEKQKKTYIDSTSKNWDFPQKGPKKQKDQKENQKENGRVEWSPVTKAYRLGGCGALVLSLHPSEAPLARHPKMGQMSTKHVRDGRDGHWMTLVTMLIACDWFVETGGNC